MRNETANERESVRGGGVREQKNATMMRKWHRHLGTPTASHYTPPLMRGSSKKESFFFIAHHSYSAFYRQHNWINESSSILWACFKSCWSQILGTFFHPAAAARSVYCPVVHWRFMFKCWPVHILLRDDDFGFRSQFIWSFSQYYFCALRAKRPGEAGGAQRAQLLEEQLSEGRRRFSCWCCTWARNNEIFHRKISNMCAHLALMSVVEMNDGGIFMRQPATK